MLETENYKIEKKVELHNILFVYTSEMSGNC